MGKLNNTIRRLKEKSYKYYSSRKTKEKGLKQRKKKCENF